MTPQSKKVVVFDFGGVIFNTDATSMYREIFEKDGRSEAELEYFLDNIFTHEDRSRANNAKTAAAVTEPLAKQHPEWAKYILAFNADRDFLKIIKGTMPGMEQTLKDIKAAGHEIYGLTNWSGDTFDALDAAYPSLTGMFNKIVVSGKVGIKKPNPDFYKHAHKEFGSPDASNVYFFDDKPRNTTGAQESVGWNAHVFKDAATVRKVLGMTSRKDI